MGDLVKKDDSERERVGGMTHLGFFYLRYG